MVQKAEIFKKNYDDYCAQIAKIDFVSVKDKLGLEQDGDQMNLRFANELYSFSGNQIKDSSGNRPGYAICVVLFKYILLCPDPAPYDANWVSFKDFKTASHMGNMSLYASETELLVQEKYSGRLNILASACEKIGGSQAKMEMPYDLAMEIDMLPRIRILVLFNDKDEEFPPVCRVLFQKHSEFYLDPESMIIATAVITNKLVQLGEN